MAKDKKKKKVNPLLISFLIVSLIGAGVLFAASMHMDKLNKAKAAQEQLEYEQMEWITPKYYKFEDIKWRAVSKMKSGKFVDVYHMPFQKAAKEVVADFRNKKDTKYTINEPLLILDPYGTTPYGMYFYYECGERVTTRYTITVKDSGIAPQYATLYTNKTYMPLAVQEGQITGLIPGKTNYIIIYSINELGEEVGKAGYKLDIPGNEDSLQMLETEMVRHDNQMESGMFVQLGDGMARAYDSMGTLRGQIVTAKKPYNTNIGFYDGGLLIACGKRRLAHLDRFGNVEAIYSLGKEYRIDGEFAVDDVFDKAYVPVIKTTKKLIKVKKDKGVSAIASGSAIFKTDDKNTASGAAITTASGAAVTTASGAAVEAPKKEKKQYKIEETKVLLEVDLYNNIITEVDASAFPTEELETGLTQSFDTVQKYGSNYVVTSKKEQMFAEYNSDENPIVKYTVSKSEAGDPVRKLNMEGYWFGRSWNGER